MAKTGRRVSENNIGAAYGKWQLDLDHVAIIRRRLHHIRMNGMSAGEQTLSDGHFLLAALDDAAALVELLLVELYGPKRPPEVS